MRYNSTLRLSPVGLFPLVYRSLFELVLLGYLNMNLFELDRLNFFFS
jgi:hypothetical protein